MQEQLHILKVLKEVHSALKNKNYIAIKNLSNQVVHTSSIEQDPDVISVAVIIYALSKVIEREKYQGYKNYPAFYKNYIQCLNNMILGLEKNDLDKFREEIEHIRNLIQNLSGHLKDYISEVFRKSKINKASRIYEHGISMEKTAKILGISVWELAEYAGQTGIADVDLSITMPIKERVKIVEEIFK
ncbi:MAG: hypothetical protein PHF67_01010 [Candidatus Nanoarchaeia archaeon]|nr:hypothetical protein [Candidatus Nanoarchaeia archaeon]